MRAMVLTGIRAMEPREAPEPSLGGEHDVLLRIDTVGVCGSDIHYYAHGRIGSQVVRYPFTVGHECAATVLAAGGAVRRVRPGDRVAVDPAQWCGRCDQCLAGRFHTCRALRFLGCPGQGDGCLVERLVMPETSCFPVPAGLSQEQAALSEPFSIGVYAVALAQLSRDPAVAILGCGPIGLSVLVALRAAGVRRIYATDPIAGRAALAKRLGARWAGDPAAVEAIVQAEPLLCDAVVECCGQQAAIDQAVELLKPGGALVMVGIPETERISLSIDRCRRKEIRFQNVRRQNECTGRALELMAAGAAPLEALVTHRFPFAQTRAAFDLVAGYRDGVVKAMIQVAGP